MSNVVILQLKGRSLSPIGFRITLSDSRQPCNYPLESPTLVSSDPFGMTNVLGSLPILKDHLVPSVLVISHITFS